MHESTRQRMTLLAFCAAAALPTPFERYLAGGIIWGGSGRLARSAAVLLPALLLRKSDPKIVTFRFWPRQPRWRELGYIRVSIPLAWSVIQLRFFRWNPELPSPWRRPEVWNGKAVWRLGAGINLVGLWDEFDFVNTVFAILRFCHPGQGKMAF